MALFYISCFFLAAVNYDDYMQSWYFHTQITHVDGRAEFVYKPSSEDGVVGVVEIYYVEGYIFCSCIFLTSEADLEGYFS